MNPYYQNQMVDSHLDIESQSQTLKLNHNSANNTKRTTNNTSLDDKDCEKCFLECCLGVTCEVLCHAIFGIGFSHSSFHQSS